MSIIAAEWGTGQVFWSMLWFSSASSGSGCSSWCSRTSSAAVTCGLAKTLWVIFVIFVPYLGVFVYLIAHGHKMGSTPRSRRPSKMQLPPVRAAGGADEPGQPR